LEKNSKSSHTGTFILEGGFLHSKSFQTAVTFITKPKKQWQFFLEGLFQKIIYSFGFWVHTQLQRRIMSGFGTLNLNIVSNYIFWRGYFRKLFNPSVFDNINLERVNFLRYALILCKFWKVLIVRSYTKMGFF
jgi:hypothetical protein